MSKSLKKRLRFWRNKSAEPGDVSHHFRGKRCISECELYTERPELLRALVLEWLVRNPGVRLVTELVTGLSILTQAPLRDAIEMLRDDGLISVSMRHDMLVVGWAEAVEITPGAWLECALFDQENGGKVNGGRQATD